MQNCLVSVIIPTYNREKTILRSVNSVLEQSHENLQVIVVDDGSKDSTLELLRDCIKDSRLSVIRQNHGGACKARNIGLANSTGELVAFQDSDDEWHPEKIACQIDNMSVNNSHYDFCSMEVVEGPENGKAVIPRHDIISEQIHRQLLHGNFISSQMLLLKRECFEQIKWNEEIPRMQDYELMLGVSKHFVGSHTNRILVRQYIQSDSISLSGSRALSEARRIIWEEYKDDFKAVPQEASLYLLSWARGCVDVLSNDEYWSLIKQGCSYKMSISATKCLIRSLLLRYCPKLQERRQ